MLSFDFAVFVADKIKLIKYQVHFHDVNKNIQHTDLIKQVYAEHYGIPILYLDKAYKDILLPKTMVGFVVRGQLPVVSG